MSTGRVSQLVAIGAFFWFLAALVIHYVPVLFSGGVQTLLLFLGVIPTAWGFNRMVARLVKLKTDELLFGLTVVCVTGLVLDGIFLTWVRSLYGADTETILVGAAWLLFGVGIILTTAMLMSRPEPSADRIDPVRRE